MKKILIFSTAYIPFIGGAEIAVKNITDRLKGDFEFHMITLNLDGKQKKEDNDPVGNVTVHRIGGPGKISKLLFPFTAFLKAFSLHKQYTFDATWSIMASFGGFAALFFKKKNPHIPFVLTLQEGDPIPEIEHKVRLVKGWFRQIFTRADTVQAISHYLGDWARNMGSQNIVVIPNGVNVTQFENKNVKRVIREKTLGFTEGDVCLITTSRLTEKNAIDVIIDALCILPSKYKLLILGVGHLEKVLEQKVFDLHLETRVYFLGLKSPEGVISSLHESDIFIRPSRSEGMGNSFIEAMAAGIPVIATPVGGIVDFLEDGKTGLFCEVDNPNSIAEAVVRLDTDTNLRESIIANAKHMVKERYDWDLIAERMKKEVFVNI